MPGVRADRDMQSAAHSLGLICFELLLLAKQAALSMERLCRDSTPYFTSVVGEGLQRFGAADGRTGDGSGQRLSTAPAPRNGPEPLSAGTER